MKNITIIISILLLTACSAKTYHNAPDDVAEDCRKQSTFQNYNAQAGDIYGQATMGPELNENMMLECIKARGYETKEGTCRFFSCTAPTFD